MSIKPETDRAIHAIHRNLGLHQKLTGGVIGGFSMISAPSDAAIDQIVATCNGDLRGALKALLLVNEHLEVELQQLYAAVAHGGLHERSSSALH
jgi:hypothetical protein